MARYYLNKSHQTMYRFPQCEWRGTHYTVSWLMLYCTEEIAQLKPGFYKIPELYLILNGVDIT